MNFGLGDLAYYLLRPGVLAYDWLYGTDLRDCAKCKRRRKAWNRWGARRRLAATFFVTLCAWVISWWVR